MHPSLPHSLFDFFPPHFLPSLFPAVHSFLFIAPFFFLPSCLPFVELSVFPIHFPCFHYSVIPLQYFCFAGFLFHVPFLFSFLLLPHSASLILSIHLFVFPSHTYSLYFLPSFLTLLHPSSQPSSSSLLFPIVLFIFHLYFFLYINQSAIPSPYACFLTSTMLSIHTSLLHWLLSLSSVLIPIFIYISLYFPLLFFFLSSVHASLPTFSPLLLSSFL